MVARRIPKIPFFGWAHHQRRFSSARWTVVRGQAHLLLTRMVHPYPQRCQPSYYNTRSSRLDMRRFRLGPQDKKTRSSAGHSSYFISYEPSLTRRTRFWHSGCVSTKLYCHIIFMQPPLHDIGTSPRGMPSLAGVSCQCIVFGRGASIDFIQHSLCTNTS